MKKFVAATLGLGSLIAAPAMAADMAVKAPMYKAPPPVYVFSWTGCYVGGHVGGLWAHQEWTVAPGDPFFLSGAPFGTHDANSWIGGVQAGCDYQFAGGFVVGIAGDYGWTDAKG